MKQKLLITILFLSMLCSFQSFAGWIQNEDETWSYERNGEILKNRWVKDAGSLYYVDENGIMATGEYILPSGQDTVFEDDGRWLQGSVNAKELLTKSFVNTEDDYTIYFPSGAVTQACLHKFWISDNATFTIEIVRMDNPESLSLDECADIYSRSLGVTLISTETVEINHFNFTKYSYEIDSSNGQRLFNAYLYPEGDEVLFVGAIYHLTAETVVDEIIGTIRKSSQP
ncbi:MAG: hypothetical protein ACRDBO_09635 [Lachnospiraceae bacterium]